MHAFNFVTTLFVNCVAPAVVPANPVYVNGEFESTLAVTAVLP